MSILILDWTNVAFTVTNNGSNTVKGFKEYQEVEQELEEGASTDGPSEDEAEDNITEVMSVDVGKILSHADNSNDVFLPKHTCCTSQTLSLIARSDFSKVLAGDTGTLCK